MRRTLLSTSLLSFTLLLIGATAAAAASLIRIETRPFYGATITIEEGVRVYRPLPSHRHIIINPDGKTPLNLTFEERNTVVHHHQYQYSDGGSDDVRFSYGGGFFPGDRSKDRRVRHHRRHGGGHIIHVPRSSRGSLGVR